MKSCGSCKNFIKLMNDETSSGMCDRKDCRTFSDAGRKCREWKGIKYKRKIVIDR